MNGDLEMDALNPTVKLGEDEVWAVLPRLVSTPTCHFYGVNTVANYIPNCIKAFLYYRENRNLIQFPAVAIMKTLHLFAKGYIT